MLKEKKKDKTLPKGFVKNPELDKYANQVFFKEKVDKANEILKTAGVPKL